MPEQPQHTYPLLDTIDSPADLRRLPLEQLPALCHEIRQKLIDEVSVNPGHFASNMGAVELTVALHYVFDTPSDRLVWDVGHQAYVHKLLTGRRQAFATNRKLGGISGFPNPAESQYDTFAAGHASNSISAALGMAIASNLKGEDRHVVAVIGDASISNGLAFEGLNNASVTPNNLLIVLNDNDMSIDLPTGSLNSYLSHVTTSKAYNNFRFKLYKTLKKLHLVTESGKKKILRFNNSIKSLISQQQNIFEGLNIRYFGPFDGHDVIRMVHVLRDIKDMNGPRILHLRTVKGKGYAPAEQNPAAWHAPGRFDAATGQKVVTASPYTKFQDVFGKTLLDMARADQRIVGITAAMPTGTSMGIMQAAMPQRVFDVGISEGHAVTFAGGLAAEGMRPFVAIYSSFMQRAYDNIIHDCALRRLPVTLCLDRAGLVGEDGPTHHGAFDLAYLRPIPNLVVCSPATGSDLRNLLYTAATRQPDGPWAIRYPRGNAPDADWDAGKPQTIAVGTGRQLRHGTQAAVLTIGPIAATAAQAIDMLGNKASVAHYDMRFLKPLDQDILQAVAQSGMPIVTVEDGVRTGGLGTAVAEWLADHGYDNHLTIVGLPDEFVTHGSVAELQHLCGIDAPAIAQAIDAAIATANHTAIQPQNIAQP